MVFLKKMAIPGLSSLMFAFSIPTADIKYTINFSMTGFEMRTYSGVTIDRSNFSLCLNCRMSTIEHLICIFKFYYKMTRFGEISPFWQHVKSLWHLFEGLFSMAIFRKLSIFLMSKNLTNNLPIWSHWKCLAKVPIFEMFFLWTSSACLIGKRCSQSETSFYVTDLQSGKAKFGILWALDKWSKMEK